VAEMEYERASVNRESTIAKYEAEATTALDVSKGAREAEVNLMNSRAEEDRAVKERAAVESTGHEAYFLVAPIPAVAASQAIAADQLAASAHANAMLDMENIHLRAAEARRWNQMQLEHAHRERHSAERRQAAQKSLGLHYH